MSYVTNVIITSCIERDEDGSVGWKDGPPITHINKILGRTGQFKEIGDHAGGPKCIESDIYACAFNGFPEWELIEAIQKAPWDFPEEVQVYIKDQDDDFFEEVFRGGKLMRRWAEYAEEE